MITEVSSFQRVLCYVQASIVSGSEDKSLLAFFVLPNTNAFISGRRIHEYITGRCK